MTSHPIRPALVVVSLAALLTACSTADAPEVSPAGAAGPGTPATTGLGHVHALGVDPADGMLYAASHRGLFSVEDGQATQVGESTQDTMGFTVVGPGTFLGSGHPDLAVDPAAPGLLGLIRSGDAGQSWTSVSLLGRTDFHQLVTSGDTILGWDSTSSELLASTDQGLTWEVRGTLPLISLVVDPDNADSLIAVTPTGLVGSQDGGQTWTPVAGAPALSLVAVDQAGTLYGVTSIGQVHVSDDDGSSWQASGTVQGRPEAIVASAAAGQVRLVVAVSDRGIVSSTDLGATFSVLV